MVNRDRLASRLRQDAQCLAPDLQKLMPDVEYDDATWGSICSAGDAYRKTLWIDPDKIAKKPWEDRVADRNAVEKRSQNMAVDVASKAIGHGDRQSVVSGKGVSVRVDLGGGGINKKK